MLRAKRVRQIRWVVGTVIVLMFVVIQSAIRAQPGPYFIDEKETIISKHHQLLPMNPVCVLPRITNTHSMIAKWLHGRTTVNCPKTPYPTIVNLNMSGWLQPTNEAFNYLPFNCSYRQIDGFLFPNSDM
jgi:hypothetical protein